MLLNGNLSAIGLCKPQYWVESLSGRVVLGFILLPQKGYQKIFLFDCNLTEGFRRIVHAN